MERQPAEPASSSRPRRIGGVEPDLCPGPAGHQSASGPAPLPEIPRSTSIPAGPGGQCGAASPSRAAPRPVSRMGSTSQSTAAPDTSAYRLVLIPRSTSTGKVAMERKPRCRPFPTDFPQAQALSASRTGGGGAFSLPAVFPRLPDCGAPRPTGQGTHHRRKGELKAHVTDGAAVARRHQNTGHAQRGQGIRRAVDPDPPAH